MSYELFNLNAPAVNEDASGHADIFKEERLADADLCICISSKTDSIAAIAGETTAKKQRLSQCAGNKFPVHLVLLRKCPFFDSQVSSVPAMLYLCSAADCMLLTTSAADA